MSKTIIVTGANTGIGFAVAESLARARYDVILACRNVDSGRQAADKIRAGSPDAKVTVMKLDVSDFPSIRQFVTEFRQMQKPLYCLINNAGISFAAMATDRQLSNQGHELTMATNYLGPALLTLELRPELISASAAHGRAAVVNVASSMHDAELAQRATRGKRAMAPLDPDDLMMASPDAYYGMQAYKNSKAALLMFTYCLAPSLREHGVVVNALCPGFIPSTSLVRNSSYVTQFFVKYVLGGLLASRARVATLEQGCELVNRLVEEAETGGYHQHGERAPSAAETTDAAKQRRLWEVTRAIIGVDETLGLEG